MDLLQLQSSQQSLLSQPSWKSLCNWYKVLGPRLGAVIRLIMTPSPPLGTCRRLSHMLGAQQVCMGTPSTTIRHTFRPFKHPLAHSPCQYQITSSQIPWLCKPGPDRLFFRCLPF